MSKQSYNDFLTKFNDVASLTAPLSVVEHVTNKLHKYASEILSLYDVNHITNAFDCYKSGKIDKEYFGKWCTFYSTYLYTCVDPYSGREYAYHVIADTLTDDELTFDEKLEQIIYHNDVLEGKIPVPYLLASNYEIFYTSVDEKASLRFWGMRKQIADYEESHDCDRDCDENIECYECPKNVIHPDNLDAKSGNFLVLHVNQATKQYSAYQIDDIIPDQYFDVEDDVLGRPFTYQHLIYDAFMCYVNAVHELGFEQVEVETLYE